MSDISKKTLIIADHGLYTYVAQHLGKYFGKVQYLNPRAEPYSRSPQNNIGQGLPGVEFIDNMWDYIDKADCLFFPDIYDGELQAFLREKGYLVCGAGKCEILELDKAHFKEILDDVGLPVPYTYRAEGLDETWEFLKDKEPGSYFVKNGEIHRGDWETVKFQNKYQFELYLNKKRQELGVRGNDIELLIERKIKSACEVGPDGFMLDGVMAPYSMVGYEVKDEGYVGKAFEKLPKIILDVNEKLKPVFQKIGGYAGPFSQELRITEGGKAYPIDLTCRCPSPPTGAELAVYGKSYAEAIWSLANGKMPELKREDGDFGAEIVLASNWHENNELHVGMPKDMKGIMLKNAVRRKGEYYCIPNDNAGVFGSVVGAGKTLKEATDKCLDAVKELDVFHLDWEEVIFDKAQETIENGRKYGIDM